MSKIGWGLGLMGAVALGVIAILGVSASGHAPSGLTGVVIVHAESTPAWIQRVARVDEALERSHLDRATFEWREAYDAAPRSGRSEALIAVGDLALRIAERGGGSDYFRAEARDIYVHAALRASAERSRSTIRRMTERLTQLGDTERAGQLRRIAGSLS